MPDVIALGELLIDFVPTVSGKSLAETPAFSKNAGGAPANVAVGLAKLGVLSSFMGKVGDDPFGKYLAETLKSAGVDISGLIFSDDARTALAFVSLQSGGERDFLFYRHPSADMLLKPEEINDDIIRASSIFHFGSISLISEPSRSATMHAVEIARKAGVLVSYDPNLRLSLWAGEQAARGGLMLGWPYAHVIKVSQDELNFLSGSEDVLEGADRLWHAEQKLLVVTQGSEGCSFITRSASGKVEGFPVTPVDTTGAGDGFVAGLLYGLVKTKEPWEDPAALREMCRFANAVGALTTTKRGAIPALPTAAEVQQFLDER